MEGVAQQVEELTAEDAREDADRQEEAGPAGDPPGAIGADPAAGDDAVQVRVQRQVLAPGVQDGQEADPGPQVFGVGGDLQQRPRGGLEQGAVDHPLVGQCQGVEGVGEREDDVEVLHRQQLRRPLVQPRRARRPLALGAVPVATRVVARAAVPAAVAGLHVPAQRGRAAGGQVVQDAALLARQLGHEGTEPPDHVRQLRRRNRRRRGRCHRRHGCAGCCGC
jgi:hypothetical protein